MVVLIVLAILAIAIVGMVIFVLSVFGSFGNFIAAVLNTVIGVAWSIEKFILGIMEALEFVARSLLGIGTTLDDYTEFAKANNLTETFVKTFKAIVGVSIVLMIVFTIIAIVRQETANITSAKPSSSQNEKGPIMMKLLRGIMSIIVLPIAMIIIIGGVNAVLTSFSVALNGGRTSSIAANILSLSSYDANKYRRYANADKRVPIIIQAYSNDDFDKDEKSKLYQKITSTKVQNELFNIGNQIKDVANSRFLTFKDSLTYSNNKLSNSSKYGSIYESFVCTAEQYQVMAEFIDYAQLSQQEFYIRAVDDDAIDWKYVDTAVYDKDKKSLTINYKNASQIDCNGTASDTYTITYSMGYDVSSPISNALETIKALLGLGEYKDNTYNTMEREDGSINAVKWENEKASLHFSRDFDKYNAKTWTAGDQILMYEFYHYSANNDFSSYDISRLNYSEAVSGGKPITSDVYKLNYRDYYPSTNTYSDEKTIYCTLINGNYYVVEQSSEEMDEYGNYYFTLKPIKGDYEYKDNQWTQEDVKFLAETYRTIFEYSGNNKNYTYLELSSDFNINDQGTWTYTDQIIMYEYYKDLSYINNLSSYRISDFKNNGGVKLPTYVISEHNNDNDTSTKSAKYVYLNGVYYEVAENGDKFKLKSGGQKDFLETINSSSKSFYNFQINLSNAQKYGISTNGDGKDVGATADDYIIVSNDPKDQATYFSNYYYYYSIDTISEIFSATDPEAPIAYKKDSNGKYILKNGIVVSADQYDPSMGERDPLLDENGNQVYQGYIKNKAKLLRGKINESFQKDSFEKYDNFVLRFSENFDYTNVSTWTYRDYFILYLYAKYLSYSGNITIDQLMTNQGISGTLGKIGLNANASNLASDKDSTSSSDYKAVIAKISSEDDESLELNPTDRASGITKYEYLFKVSPMLSYIGEKDGDDVKATPVEIYLKIEDIMNISEKNILNDFELDDTFYANDYDYTTEQSFLIETFNLIGTNVTFTKTQTENKVFNFSSSFVYNDVDTWTMQDYLLLLLDQSKYIDIAKSLNSTSTDFSNMNLSSYSYSSLVYIFNDTSSSMNGKKVYVFGNDNKKVYLNEDYITRSTDGGLGYSSIDNWLNTKLYEALFKQLGSNTGSLRVETNDLINQLFNTNNLASYVRSGNQKLLEYLINKYVINANSPIFNQYSDIIEYSYSNPDFVFNDLSSWTKLDLVMYLINGNVEFGTKKFKVVTDGNSNPNYYLIIGDYAVNIKILNSDTTNATLSDIYSLASSLTSVISDDDNGTDLGALSTFKNLKSRCEFIAKNGDGMTVKDNADYTYTFKNEATYTYLDVILTGLSNETDPSLKIKEVYSEKTEYKFKIYQLKDSEDTSFYIHLGTLADGRGLFYKLDEGDAEPMVTRSTSSTLNFDTSDRIFTKSQITNTEGDLVDETYSSFANLYLEKQDPEADPNDPDYLELKKNYLPYKMTILDAIIYNYEKDANFIPSTYNIYSFNNGSHKFICLGNKIIEYKDEYAELIDTSEKLTKSVDDAEKENDYKELINNLYDNIYRGYVEKVTSGIKDMQNVTLKVTFDINNPQTWTPLNIILYKNSYIESNVSDLDLVYQYAQNAYDSYLVIKAGADVSYIKISDFVMSDEENAFENVTNDYIKITADSKTIYFSNVFKRKFFYNAYLAYCEINQDESINRFTENFNSNVLFTNYNDYVKTLSTLSDVKLLSANLKAGTEFNIDDISTWTWFEMLYYYLFKTNNTTESYYKYYSAGKTFLTLSNTNNSNIYYLDYNPNEIKYYKTTFAKDSKIIDVNFDFSASEIKKFALIYRYYTKNNSGFFEKYTFDLTNENLEVYTFDVNGDTMIIAGLKPDELIVRDTDSSLSGLFTYQSQATRTNIRDWTVFDIVLKNRYGNSDIYAKSYTGSLIKFGSSVYFSIDSYMYNLTSVKATYSNGQVYCNTKFIDYIGGNEISSFDSSTKVLFTPDSNLQPKFVTSSTDDASREQESYVKLYFSNTFNFSDITTWKLSDYFLYYVYEKCMEDSTYHNFDDTQKNFQYYVNQGYIPASIFTVMFSSDNSGSSTRTALVVGNYIKTIDPNNEKYICADYTMFYDLYAKSLYHTVLKTDSSLHSINLVITGSSKDTSDVQNYTEFGIKFNNTVSTGDLIYKNYYYFTALTDLSAIWDYHPELKVDISKENQIKEGMPLSKKYVNLKLSNDFVLSNPDTWTILDYIILRAYTEERGTNIFNGLTFNDLRTSNLFAQLYSNDDETYILKINGRYYNLKYFVTETSDEVMVTEKINSMHEVSTSPDGEVIGFGNNIPLQDGKTPFVKVANVLDSYDYTFKVLANSIAFVLSENRIKPTTLQNTPTNIAYTIESEVTWYDENVNIKHASEDVINRNEQVNVTYYRELETNTYWNYQLSLNNYRDYTISPYVKKVNWPQKLLNDMQVMYPDLNWGTLYATDGWLDTLGDYHSGTASGIYIQTGNSANITAVGMVLSEFFLSIANKVDPTENYSNYQYSSIYDEKVIDALMLSTMGEENYNAVKLEAEVFVNMFNTGFAAILDDIALERGINIVDGKVSNLAMSIYKSYLATAILSSDFGEYLYTVATRVYSQYTIFEYLAKASNHPEQYYAYITGQTDEDGNVIDAFKYSSFEELVEYENKYIEDNEIPMFTFNKNAVKSALKLQTNNTKDLLKALENEYYNVYVAGAKNEEKISTDDPRYCFLLDVYYTIKQNLTLRGSSSEPVYLQLFKKFIYGEIERWNSVQDASITGGSVYVKDYKNYKFSRSKASAQSVAKYLLMYVAPSLSGAVNTIKNYYSTIGSAITGDVEGAVEDAKNTLQSAIDLLDVKIRKASLLNTFAYSEYYDDLEKIFPSSFLDLWDNLRLFANSEKGDAKAWSSINKYYETLGNVLSTLSELVDANVNDSVNGAVKLEDINYDDLINCVSGLYNAFGSYISNQNIIDKIEKTCITFTLAQYGNNYVEEGFKFTIKNKEYSFKSTVSAQRLAEYVYGGKFLTQFGVKPSYTNDEFEGMIEKTTAYDSASGLTKTKLESFKNLRQFARSIADYSGKLYTITNMNDLSANSNDSINLTEDIYIKNPLITPEGSSDTSLNHIKADSIFNRYYIKANLSYLILDYIVANKCLSVDSLYTLIVAEDNVEEIVNNCDLFNDDCMNLLIPGNFYDPANENKTDEKIVAIREYLMYMLTTTSKAVYKTTVTKRTTEPMGTTTNGETTITVTETQVITTVLTELLNTELDGYYGYYSENGYTGTYSTIGVNSSDNVKAGDRSYTVLKKVITYLTGYSEKTTSDDDIKFDGTTVELDGFNFKQLKNLFIEALANYREYENASGEENTQRYLTLFYLISGEFDYYTYAPSEKNITTYKDANNWLSSSETEVGRLVNIVNKNVDKSSYVYNDARAVSYKSFEKEYYLRAGFRVDSQTKGMILKLAGINNRPIEELVNLEYNDMYNKNGCYDEADGDTFIICTYDEANGIYYPVLATSEKFYKSGNQKMRDYLDQSFALNFDSDYYDSKYAYPVIARGILDAQELPTAIKMVNGEVQFYRTFVTTSASLSENSLQTANINCDVTTVNYTTYVNAGTFDTNGLSKYESKTMFTGSTAKSFEIKSDANMYYVQYTMNYKYDYENDQSGVAVLDNFNSFFNLNFSGSSSFHILLVVGFMVMIPILFKVVLAAMRRILDLMFLVLVGPLAIATDQISYQDKHGNTYSMWRTKTEKALLMAFGLVVSFSVYYILMSTIMNMTFVTAGDATMEILNSNSAYLAIKTWPIVRHLTTPEFINTLVKFSFILVACGMVESASNMIGVIVTGGRVEKSFNSQLSDTDPLDDLTKFARDAKNAVEFGKNIYSGKILVDAKHAMIEKAKRAIPGSAFIARGIEKGKDLKRKVTAKGMEKTAISQGVSPALAKKFSKEFYDNSKAIAKAKRDDHIKKANEFQKTMSLVSGSKNPQFENTVDKPLLGKMKPFKTDERRKKREEKAKAKIQKRAGKPAPKKDKPKPDEKKK